jgi:hypothetical protein
MLIIMKYTSKEWPKKMAKYVCCNVGHLANFWFLKVETCGPKCLQKCRFFVGMEMNLNEVQMDIIGLMGVQMTQ